MARSIILGAGGFLGHHLAHALAARGERPVLAGLSAPLSLPGPADQITSGHLTGFDALDPHAEEGATCYYLISTMTPSNSAGQPSAFIAANLELFVRFLEWAEQRPGIRVVYVSSGGTVYGNADVLPTPETAPLKPISFYGLLKAAAEQHLRLFADRGRLSGTVLRLANPFGPGQRLNRGQGLVPAILSRVRAGEPVDILDEGRAVRDYLYIDDAVEAMILGGQHPALVNETVNVGTGKGTSVMEVVQLIERELGQAIPKRFAAGRAADVAVSTLDASRLTRLIGWSPRFTLEEGLKACIAAELAS
ncbi:NAD-dependent epimerase/dehydratase family protein [Hyphomonas sp.]|uniref:NAD-dependent epimerase/dehydratase family protein n=1 Tax=Hyphomonas sp. TaxID=87 RepID=UPI00391DC170